MSRATDPSTAALPFANGAPGGNSASNGSPNGSSSDERAVLAKSVHDGLAAKHVCPFCGSQNTALAGSNGSAAGPCPRCTMEDTAATRQATKARIGPWHVLQTRNPAAPGMRYATLLALVGKGQITAKSVVRGPTTHQLWRFAAHVRGLSREFGVCYSCGDALARTDTNCPHCERMQEPVGNPDALLEIRENALANGSVHLPAQSTSNGSESLPIDAKAIVASNRTPQSQPAPAAPVSHADRIRAANEPRNDARTDLRRREGRVLSAMELAAALQISPPAGASKQTHPLRTTVLTVLCVAVIGSLILGYARPDLRRQAIDWAQVKWTPLQERILNFHLQKPPPGQSSSTSIDVAPPAPVSSVNDHNVSNPRTPPAELATPEVVQPVPGPTPETKITITPGERAPVLPSAPAVPSPDHSVVVGPGPSAKEIRALHSQGLDAEGRQDYAEAIRCYEQIMQAPKELWPGDIQVRLDIARRQVNH